MFDDGGFVFLSVELVSVGVRSSVDCWVEGGWILGCGADNLACGAGWCWAGVDMGKSIRVGGEITRKRPEDRLGEQEGEFSFCELG